MNTAKSNVPTFRIFAIPVSGKLDDEAVVWMSKVNFILFALLIYSLYNSLEKRRCLMSVMFVKDTVLIILLASNPIQASTELIFNFSFS